MNVVDIELRPKKVVAAAEKFWRSCAYFFRLAGIYGLGSRNAIETVRAGRARRIFKRGQVFSRIHVDDISQALAASIACPNSGRIYNICDNEAAPPQDVITYACRSLGELSLRHFCLLKEPIFPQWPAVFTQRINEFRINE